MAEGGVVLASPDLGKEALLHQRGEVLAAGVVSPARPLGEVGRVALIHPGSALGELMHQGEGEQLGALQVQLSHHPSFQSESVSRVQHSYNKLSPNFRLLGPATAVLFGGIKLLADAGPIHT